MLRKRYFILLQLLASFVCIVYLLAVLLPKRFDFLLRHPDALQQSWYAAILVLLTSFAIGFLLLLLCLWRKRPGQALKWLLVALPGLGLGLFFWSATMFILMGFMGDPGPAEAARMEARERIEADSLDRLHESRRLP
ncbi:hypothetical protein [Hymenobacter metallicola]|uniref:Uncharacterized protein n=1 Tax=Hymenobacter metallicola TaxID=2563114 RepID=A0A4Z0Q9D8_9BACT|nr:hypothetical protein [Hymenobacter metallicola]TGE26640.1 hypothetical protein E5K02_17815 [Hymenobacter metallicola]